MIRLDSLNPGLGIVSGSFTPSAGLKIQPYATVPLSAERGNSASTRAWLFDITSATLQLTD